MEPKTRLNNIIKLTISYLSEILIEHFHLAYKGMDTTKLYYCPELDVGVILTRKITVP